MILVTSLCESHDGDNSINQHEGSRGPGMQVETPGLETLRAGSYHMAKDQHQLLL